MARASEFEKTRELGPNVSSFGAPSCMTGDVLGEPHAQAKPILHLQRFCKVQAAFFSASCFWFKA